MDIGKLQEKNLGDLRGMARELNIPGFSSMKKPDLILNIMLAEAEAKGLDFRGGVLEVK